MSAEPAREVRHGKSPEITWPAILIGCALGSVIAVSIGYLSLELGFSMEGSELAAILGCGILRGVMRAQVDHREQHQPDAALGRQRRLGRDDVLDPGDLHPRGGWAGARLSRAA